MSEPGEISRRGIMLVLSSPSGAGKTTLTRNLLQQENEDDPGKLELSVSVTTREKRASEIAGVHYQFVEKRQFEAMRDRVAAAPVLRTACGVIQGSAPARGTARPGS